jgi:hypothetical protein
MSRIPNIPAWAEMKTRLTTRETREGWPVLTVETEVNRDSKSANERGPSFVGSTFSNY